MIVHNIYQDNHKDYQEETFYFQYHYKWTVQYTRLQQKCISFIKHFTNLIMIVNTLVIIQAF